MNLPVVAPKRGLLQKNLSGIASRLTRKQTIVPPGTGAGWGSAGMVAGSSQLTWDMKQYIATYGGELAVTWIYACVTLIMEEMALYPYDFVNPRSAAYLGKATPIPYAKVPDDLRSLFAQPNRLMTYFDFMNYKEMDTELVGNSYWLKDQRNLLGQPAQLLRLRPEFTRIAVDKAGNVAGYAYRIQGIDIPFDVDEVIHFKLPSPHSEYYGMGRVQGVLTDVGVEVGTGKTVVGFFNNGARISGVLTVSGILPDEIFDRMKQQFREEYTGADNAFSVLIAEQGMRFDAVQQAPADAGVVELKNVSKDAILAGFGIGVEMLGGTSNAGNVANHDAQVNFSRRMQPRARRNSEKLTYELTGLWGNLGVWIDTSEISEMEVKIARARDMLGAGASVNESRIAMGLPMYTPQNFPGRPPEFYDLANEPILPSGYQAWYTQPQAAAGQGRVPYGDVLPGGSNGNANGTGTPTQPAGSPDRVRTDRGLYGRRLTNGVYAIGGKELLALPSGSVLSLPEGYESLGEIDLKQADHRDAELLLELQVQVYREEVPEWEQEMVTFFNEQRGRVLRSAGRFTDANHAKRMVKQGVQLFDKKELQIGRVFDGPREDDMLRSLYTARAMGIAQRTVNQIAKQFDSAVPDIRVVVDRLADSIVGINEKTKERIAFQIAEGIRRGYSVDRIANGFPDQNYLGIQGVFDSATETRARAIARTETAIVYNAASLSSFNQIGVQRVEVLDGTMDEECEKARGKVWTLGYASRNLSGHPNCTRSFVPIFAGTGL